MNPVDMRERRKIIRVGCHTGNVRINQYVVLKPSEVSGNGEWQDRGRRIEDVKRVYGLLRSGRYALTVTREVINDVREYTSNRREREKEWRKDNRKPYRKIETDPSLEILEGGLITITER